MRDTNVSTLLSNDCNVDSNSCTFVSILTTLVDCQREKPRDWVWNFPLTTENWAHAHRHNTHNSPLLDNQLDGYLMSRWRIRLRQPKMEDLETRSTYFWCYFAVSSCLKLVELNSVTKTIPREKDFFPVQLILREKVDGQMSLFWPLQIKLAGEIFTEHWRCWDTTLAKF